MLNQVMELTITELFIKNSRFIGLVIPVTTVSSASLILNEVRLEHKSANHSCFAYSVGFKTPIERFSDDGEPSGTAGRPVLEVIRRRNLSNTLIIVTRYFGGVLLGANGLIRAYTQAAFDAVDAAELISCEQLNQLRIKFDYGQFGKLEHELTQAGYNLLNTTFTEHIEGSIWTRLNDVEMIMDKIADWTNGKADVTVCEAKWIGTRPNGELAFGVCD